MSRRQLRIRVGMIAVLCFTLSGITTAQESQTEPSEEFGPVVRAYLGYLDGEQEVVDDRASRREISAKYYRRNSNRIRALRQIAISIAQESGQDYLPELEAATRDELKTLFEKPPYPRSFRIGLVLNNTFRYLGAVRAGELFYIFARLDLYEQQELKENEKQKGQPGAPRSTAISPAPVLPVVPDNTRQNDNGSP